MFIRWLLKMALHLRAWQALQEVIQCRLELAAAKEKGDYLEISLCEQCLEWKNEKRDNITKAYNLIL